MRLGRSDTPDGVKSVLSGLSWPLAAVMPVACGPASCLVKRDGQNPVRSLTPLGPPSFGGIRDRQRPKRVILSRTAQRLQCLDRPTDSGHSPRRPVSQRWAKTTSDGRHLLIRGTPFKAIVAPFLTTNAVVHEE